jgi:hypothetical protein
VSFLWFEDQIAGHDHASRKPWPDRQGWRNIDLTAHDLAARVADSVLCAARMALAMGSSSSVPSSAPMLSNGERTAALNAPFQS